MTKERPNWDDLSIAHSDGNGTTRNLSEEDQKWFMKAMQAQSMDMVKRMKEITLVMQTPDNILEEQGITASDIEDMLDELQDHVESMDMANDLHFIGGLSPLLSYLRNSHANIRAKAAEVVSTIVQNNPKSQHLVMEANGMELLLSNLTSDDDVTIRTKALGAISSLIRNNKPGIQAFRLANGYTALKDALSSKNIRFQRKALNLIQHLLQENPSDYNIVSKLGFPRFMRHIAANKDAEVQTGALNGLHGSVKIEIEETGNEKFKEVLQDEINDISMMSSEDLAAVREERQHVDSQSNAYYNEPSSKKKSKPWNTQEEVVLAKAWVDVSKDWETGNRESFWGQALECFNKQLGGSDRTVHQVNSKWKEMNKKITKFNDIYNKKLAQQRQSGQSEADILKLALTEYRNLNKNKGFSHEAAWGILKDNRNWNLLPLKDANVQPQKKTKTSESNAYTTFSDAQFPSDLTEEDDEELNIEEPQKPQQRGKEPTSSSCEQQHLRVLSKLTEFSSVSKQDFEDKKRHRAKIEELKEEKLRIMKEEKDERLGMMREKRKDEDMQFYLRPHDHLTGVQLNAVLARKREIAQRWGWE